MDKEFCFLVSKKDYDYQIAPGTGKLMVNYLCMKVYAEVIIAGAEPHG